MHKQQEENERSRMTNRLYNMHPIPSYIRQLSSIQNIWAVTAVIQI